MSRMRIIFPGKAEFRHWPKAECPGMRIMQQHEKIALIEQDKAAYPGKAEFRHWPKAENPGMRIMQDN